MKKFIFTTKDGSEIIGITETQKNLKDATEYFAKIKNLSVSKFNKLYEVKEKK